MYIMLLVVLAVELHVVSPRSRVLLLFYVDYERIILYYTILYYTTKIDSIRSIHILLSSIEDADSSH